MNNILATLGKSGRAAVVALALSAATVTVMPAPAMAQSPSFSFSIELGGGADLKFKGGRKFRDDFCLTNREIRAGLRAHGFRNIDIVGGRGRNRVEVIASFRGRFYLLVVNRCTGNVRIIERLGRRGFPADGPHGGFGLQFNFGM